MTLKSFVVAIIFLDRILSWTFHQLHHFILFYFSLPVYVEWQHLGFWSGLLIDMMLYTNFHVLYGKAIFYDIRVLIIIFHNYFRGCNIVCHVFVLIILIQLR